MADTFDINDITRVYNQRIQAINSLRRIGNGRQIKSMRLQALEEAQRDILNTTVTNGRLSGSRIDKNSYPTYESQVIGAYKMYSGYTDYGSELFQSVADMRVAFIGGEGVSFTSKNKAKVEYIDAFLCFNQLRGSKLIDAVLMGELEGKVLFTLSPSKVPDGEIDLEKTNVKARLFSWYVNKYVVTYSKDDIEQIDSITYKKNEGATKEEKIDMTKAVYARLGTRDYKQPNNTPTRLGKILTQCENASRATYDLRKNTHFFGKIMPYWKTASAQDSTIINKALADKSFEIGDGYAGPADMSLLEPSGSAAEQILKDALASLRYICSMTGVPIHWMAWPELMSNRATAENLMEVIYASTKKERLVWEESLKELIDKVMVIAVDSGIANAKILEGEYDIKLPLISLAALKQMTEVWLPLYQEKLVSKFTMMNMLPGIDPDQELEQLEDERAENAKNSPFANMPIPGKTDTTKNADGVTVPPQPDNTTGDQSQNQGDVKK